MSDEMNYLLVDGSVLPDVFHKVVAAKKLLAQGKAKSSSHAAQMAGISRSAFYKYKDSVFSYDERMNQGIITLYVTLEDRPGILSAVLGALYKANANIITVNQNIPVDGVALVSVSVRSSDSGLSQTQLIQMLQSLDGIVQAKAV